MSQRPAATDAAAVDDTKPLDLAEKGRGAALDRRLFMKFTAFGDCTDAEAAAAAYGRHAVVVEGGAAGQVPDRNG